jgi:superfamily II DNA or RNA helicase
MQQNKNKSYQGLAEKMKSIQLKEFQKECIEQICKHFSVYKKQLIQLPTGSGKTFIFLHYLRDYSKKSVIVVPSKELEEQVFYWGKIICKDKSIIRNRYNMIHLFNQPDIIITTAAALRFDKTKEFIKEFDFDTLVIDEAHHAQAITYKKFLKTIDQKSFNLLGCTATPERLDKKPLFEIFEHLTYKKNILDLILTKDLCNAKAFKIKTGCKISSNEVRKGDFLPKSLSKLNNETRNKILHKCFLEHAFDKKTLIFCVNINHAVAIADSLKKCGIKSAAVWGSMPLKEREKILEDFKKGDIQVISNCQLLTEGFDEPSIESLIIARPTLSKSLYCQMIGRGLRNFPGKEFCYIYELTDNAHNICDLTSTLEISSNFKKEYSNNTDILALAKEYEHIDEENIEIKKEEFNILNQKFVLNDNGYLNIFNTNFDKIKPTKRQQEKLNKHNFISEMSCLEASFILWKEKLREKYGYVEK